MYVVQSKLRLKYFVPSHAYSLLVRCFTGGGEAPTLTGGDAQTHLDVAGSLPVAIETVTSQLEILQRNVREMLQQLNLLSLAVHGVNQLQRQVGDCHWLIECVYMCVCLCVYMCAHAYRINLPID